MNGLVLQFNKLSTSIIALVRTISTIATMSMTITAEFVGGFDKGLVLVVLLLFVASLVNMQMGGSALFGVRSGASFLDLRLEEHEALVSLAV